MNKELESVEAGQGEGESGGDMASLSDDLKVELVQTFVVGFVEAIVGAPLEDDAPIPAEMAPTLADLAHECITRSEQQIAELYVENPTACYEAVYQIGVDLAVILNEVGGPAPINLN